MIDSRWVRLAALGLLACALWPRSASALDLQEVFRQVAKANPTLAARRSMVAAARDRVGPAGAWQSPMAELAAMNVPTDGRFDEVPMTMKTVSVSQRVPIFGSNGLARRSARKAVESESAATEMTHYEIYGMAWSSYADAYYAARLARLAVDQQSVMDRLVQSAQARYESGAGRLEDVLRAESERARTRVDLAAFQAEERASWARLDALRGISASSGSDTLSALPAIVVPQGPGPWLAAVDDNHPRLRQFAAQTSRYREAARSARRSVWPDLMLRGSYGQRETLANGVEQKNLFTAMVGFSVPIFAAQRQYAKGAEMDAMADMSQSQRRAMELDLQRQVLATYADAQAAQRTIGLLADTVVTTQQRAVEASWSAYTAGKTDLWRVFEATHTLYNEEISLTRARQKLEHQQARLLAITGRGDLLGISLPTESREKP